MKSLFLILFLSVQMLSAQTTFSPDENDENYSKKGWEITGNFGFYKASSYHAEYYNGKPDNLNNIDYVFNNYYWNQEIKNLMIENASRDSFSLVEYPSKMRYNAAMMAGFSFRYNYSEAFALNLHFNFAKLQLIDVFNLQVYPAYPGMVESFVPCEIYGIESRSNIDLSMMFTFNAEKTLSPIAELGFNLNNTLIKESAIRIFDNTYNLVDVYGSGGYIPNSGMTEYIVRQGGIGYGLYSAAGLRYKVSKDFSMEWVMNIYYSYIHLEGYDGFGFHYGTLFRLVLSPALLNLSS